MRIRGKWVIDAVEEQQVYVYEKALGEILSRDLYIHQSMLFMKKGTIINRYYLKNLQNRGFQKIWIYSNEQEVAAHREVQREKVRLEYRKNTNGIRNIMQSIAKGDKLDFNKVQEISHVILEDMDRYSYVMDCMNELRSADEYTYNHSINVSIYGMLLGKWSGLENEDITNIVQAGLLHDMGKAKIPNEILNKKGKLTEEEYRIMKKHAQLGYEMVKSNQKIPGTVKDSVLCHHERLDGSGYPKKIKILDLYSRIIAIADVYDALTSQRVYKKKKNPFVTVKEMKEFGYNHFDTKLLMIFLENITDYYIGSKVRMVNGKVGKIVSVMKGNKPIIEVDQEFIQLSSSEYQQIHEMIS